MSGMTRSEAGREADDHRLTMPLAAHEGRAIARWKRQLPWFDLYRCGALHLTIALPNAEVTTCAECVGESLPPLLYLKWRADLEPKPRTVEIDDPTWEQIEDVAGQAKMTPDEYIVRLLRFALEHPYPHLVGDGGGPLAGEQAALSRVTQEDSRGGKG